MRKLAILGLLLILAPICFGQASGAGQLGCNGTPTSGIVVTSATANNTVLFTSPFLQGNRVTMTLDQTTTITGGAATVLEDAGDGNFVSLDTWRLVDSTTAPFATIGNPYTLQASTNKQFLILADGLSRIQLKLTTALTGTGQMTPFFVQTCYPQLSSYQASPTNLRTAIFGNLGAAVDAVIGAVAPLNVVAEGLKDINGNSQAAKSDPNGRQFMLPYADTTTASFHASKNVSSAASATDIAVLPGNATNKVLLNKIQVSCTQTTAGIITIQIIKRSTADTAGTSSAMTVIPDYSAYTAGVSAPLVYTANPTTGTALGNLDTAVFGCMASSTTSPNDIYIFRPTKPIILNGTAEQVAVNLNGVTVTGGSFDVTFEYSETTTP